jgi:hypothetical protein
VFFTHLWQSTLEGFFSDPVYGGNRDMVAWQMIGFPGAYAPYYDLVDQHGIKIDRRPMSLAEDVHGHVHMNPGIDQGKTKWHAATQLGRKNESSFKAPIKPRISSADASLLDTAVLRDCCACAGVCGSI